jgi:hypothetical protein
MVMSLAAQFLVNKGHELVPRVSIAVAPLAQQIGYLLRCCPTIFPRRHILAVSHAEKCIPAAINSPCALRCLE